MANDDNGNKIDPKVAEELAETTAKVKSAVVDTNRAFQEQLRIVTQLQQTISQVAVNFEKISGLKSGNTSEEIKKVSTEVANLQKETKSSSGALNKMSKVLQTGLVKAVTIAEGALSGLRQGFKNLAALSKGAFGVFTSLADGAFSVAKSIISIPFKLLSGLFDMAQKGGGGNELAAAYEAVRKQFGSFTSESSRTVIDVAKNMDRMNETGVSAWRVFGNLAQRIEAVNKLAESMGNTFQVFQNEIHQNGVAIMMYQKGLGLTDEMMSSIASNAMRMGKGIAQVQNEMTKQALGMSKAFGVNAKVLSRDMGKAMQDLAHFGHLSTKEMAVTATFAQKLGVSIDKLTGIMDATATFDQAAEGMSKLNEQFGTNIDATEIMMAQNPADKVAILQKEFAKTGKSLSQMSYQERMLIKQNTGLDDSALNAALSTNGLKTSLDDIRRTGDKNEAKTLSQAEAMHELSDSIERLTQSGGPMGGGFLDHILKGFTQGIQSTPEFIELMRNLNLVLQKAFFFGMRLGKLFVDFFPGVKDVITNLSKLFSPEKFEGFFRDIEGIIKKYLGKNGNFIGNFSDMMKELKAKFFSFFDSKSPEGQKILEGYKKFGQATLQIFGKISEWVIIKLADIITSITDWIKKPKIPQVDGKGIAKGLTSPFEGAFKALTQKLGPALLDLGEQIFSLIVKGLSSDKGKKIIFGFLGTAFAPVIGKAIISSLTSFLLKGATNLIWSAFKGLGSTVGEAAGSLGTTTTGAISKVLGKVAIVAMIADAAVNISDAMKNFENDLAPEFGRTEAKMGAAATGIINTFTFGLIPKDMQKEIAKAIASLSKDLLNAVKKHMGPGFSQVLEEYIGSALDVFASLGDVIKALFSGDDAKLTSAFEDLTKKILTFLGKAIEWIAIGIPTLSVKIASMVNKFLGALLTGIGDALGPWGVTLRLTGAAFTAFGELLTKTFNFIKESIKPVLDWINEKVDWAGKQVDKLKGYLPDFAKSSEAQVSLMSKGMGSSLTSMIKDSEAKIQQATDQAKKQKERQEELKRQLDVMGPVTIENAEERFKKIEELSKKVASKDFDIQKSLNEVREKISGIDFTIVKKEKTDEIDTALLSLKSIQGIFGSIADVGGLIKVAADRITEMGNSLSTVQTSLGSEGSLPKIAKALSESFAGFDETKLKSIDEKISTISVSLNNVKNLTETVKNVSASIISATGDAETKGLTSAILAVQDMVKKTQELDSALTSLPRIDVQARLSKVAGMVGLGAKGVYTVQSKEVIINVQFNVSMDVDEVESIMIARHKSVIRDRINFAIANGGVSTENQQNAYVKPERGGNTGFYGTTIPGAGG